jgi:uncharacterized protein (TIRG00374 family)
MIIRLLRVIVSITLIGVLLWAVDWQDIGTRIRLLDPALAITAFVLLSVQYPLSAWKWRKSIQLHGGNERFALLLRVHCIGFFFNNFLPTAVGGDAYRAFKTFDATARPAHAISAVILERVLGILALLFIGYACAVYMVLFESLAHKKLIVASLVISAAAVAAAILIWRVRPWFAQQVIYGLNRVHKLEPVVCSLRTIKRNKLHFWSLVRRSLVYHALAVIIISLLFASIGIYDTVAESGIAAAVSGVATVLPISINGVGVMEGSFVVAALEVGLPYSEAVLVALFLRAYMLLASVAFAILYMLEPKAQRELPKKSAE